VILSISWHFAIFGLRRLVAALAFSAVGGPFFDHHIGGGDENKVLRTEFKSGAKPPQSKFLAICYRQWTRRVVFANMDSVHIFPCC
jgi:hypothetical protein